MAGTVSGRCWTSPSASWCGRAKLVWVSAPAGNRPAAQDWHDGVQCSIEAGQLARDVTLAPAQAILSTALGWQLSTP